MDDGAIPFQGEFPLARQFASADLDADGNSDDLLSLMNVGILEVWIGSGPALSYAEGSQLGDVETAFAAHDWDQDGDDDVVGTGPLDDLLIWNNLGPGDFVDVTWESAPLISPPLRYTAIVAGEFNGDVSADLAAIEPDVDDDRTALSTWGGAGDGSFFGETVSKLPGVYNLAARAELNGFIHDEIVLVGGSGGLIVTPAEDPESICWRQAPELSGVALATGDLDGDGRDEIAVLNDQGAIFVWNLT